MPVRKEKSQPKLPNVKLPAGFKIVAGNGFAKSFFFEKVGDTIQGVVKEVRKLKYKGDARLVMTLENDDGIFSIWDSAQLKPLMENVEEGTEVYIRFDGIKKLKGKKTMREFTTAVAE